MQMMSRVVEQVSDNGEGGGRVSSGWVGPRSVREVAGGGDREVEVSVRPDQGKVGVLR